MNISDLNLLFGEVLGDPVENLANQLGPCDRVTSYVHWELVLRVNGSRKVLKEHSVWCQIILFVTHFSFFNYLTNFYRSKTHFYTITSKLAQRLGTLRNIFTQKVVAKNYWLVVINNFTQYLQ